MQQSRYKYEQLLAGPARIIRYTTLGHDLLSTFDSVNNILRIDKEKAALLSETMLKRLQFNELPCTVLVKGRHEYVFMEG